MKLSKCNAELRLRYMWVIGAPHSSAFHLVTVCREARDFDLASVPRLASSARQGLDELQPRIEQKHSRELGVESGKGSKQDGVPGSSVKTAPCG